MSSFNSRYGTSGTVLNTCSLCHPGGNTGSQNQFARDFANSAIGNRTYNAALEGRDSDGDSYTNLVEINARTFPGDANSRPAPVVDTTAPTVTGFTIPATSASLTVSITSLAATDNIGVTGYMVTESSTAPAASATGWTATAPTSYTFTTAGTKTLYGWAKDAANNVSASRSAATTITLADTTAPTVTGFTIPATSTSLVVSISSLTATDNVGVIGYMVTESSTVPAASATGWTTTVPTSYSFTTAGAKTLYARAKDAANNVSTSRSATTTITLADTIRPTVTGFTIPATSSSLTVSISSITASDNVTVTGYIVTESATAPSASATGWTSPVPASYTFATPGSKTLYAWAKDAAGNVSTSRSAATTITLPDTTPPTVTGFTIPATSTSLTVSVSSLTATDNVGVTGFLVTESATAPAASASGWTASPPTSYTFATAGSKTLYAWAKDGSGNVSTGRSATTTVTPPDTVAPAITIFSIPATAGRLDISITLAATDNIGVAGYIVSESAAAPASSSPGWSVIPPYTYTFTSPGLKTLYAWAKDAAGNVSASVSDTTRIYLPDTTAPTVTAFTIPATSSSPTAPISAFTATDNIGVTGYMVTETAGTPSSLAPGWSTTPPTSFTFATPGSKTLFAWAKDAAGNVSSSRSATISITLAEPPPDTQAPAVTSFLIPGSSNSLLVSIQAFVASDNIAVAGFMVTESPAIPAASAAGWTAAAPTSYTFASAGTKTLYAWAKDAAGNVSASLSATLTVTLPPPPPLAGTGDRIGVFRNGLWMLDVTGNGLFDLQGDRNINFGSATDIPVAGDWDGTGITRVGVFNNGLWSLDLNGNGSWDGTPTDAQVSFGQGGDIPVLGDWNGTGFSKLGIFRNGSWVLDWTGTSLSSGFPTTQAFGFGQAGDIPVVGDWNGTGRTKIGVFRRGVWYFDVNGDGVFDPLVDLTIQFGKSVDIPVTGDWNRDGITDIGIFRKGAWAVDINNDDVFNLSVDALTAFGVAGDIPVVGNW